MEPAIFITFLLFLPLLFLLISRRSSKRLPPGSLGFPIIGQSLSMLRAMKANNAEEWLQERVRKYGPISKLSLFGSPTVFLHGPAANKFIYTCSEKLMSNKQPTSIRRIVGERNILELSGDDHRRVRAALVSFLKPETLKQYVGRIDEEIRLHLKNHWYGNNEIKVMPLMKSLTFNIICSLLFGIESGPRRDTLVRLFEEAMEGVLSVPINLPFTVFNRSLKASEKIRSIIMELIHDKREKLEKNVFSSNEDLIMSLLSMKDETSDSPVLSDDEVVDNIFVLMIAGHDTTSILLTFLIKILADNPTVYNLVLKEQEEISRGKALGELLAWEDLAKMKYTWKVAMESLRINPPVFCSFRTVLQDIEYGEYIIPKGWQVIWATCMTHMDENIYSEPTKFNPLRLESQATSPPPYSFMAFGGGPRMCPGYEFARIETLTMIHNLVNAFAWKLSLKDNFFGRNPMPVFHQGLPIRIELKKSSDAIYKIY
ncbi:Cytochrome [Abeliophyllum distichum]|uniref:Cytochrome n=1 Tax=Abeliophyllum distichum TaxID=126358 RepID=A0ABD1UG39_9LAMI